MKFFIQACLIVSLFLFFGINANAGAFICTEIIIGGCDTQSECETIGRCAIGGGSSTDACSWCDETFCADSCPECTMDEECDDGLFCTPTSICDTGECEE